MSSSQDAPARRRGRLAAFRALFPVLRSKDVAKSLQGVTAYRNLNEHRIAELKTMVAQLKQDQLATVPDVSSSPACIRPPTPVAALQERLAFQAQLSAFRQHIERFNLIPQDWAMTYLKERTKQVVEPLGCWEGVKKGSRTGGSDSRGYVQADLQKTVINGKTIGIMCYMHQLAVIARGGITELRAACKGKEKGVDTTQEFEVSHLCRNDFCFNPDHIIVEPRIENRNRQGCNGAEIITIGGFTWNPCRHAHGSQRKACLLPTRTFSKEARGYFTPDPPG
jgi:Zinc-binding loop region of homing endonuclease